MMVTDGLDAMAGGSRLVAEGRIRATYRVQFEEGFPFAAAERLAGYFAALGISHVYCSPIFEARAGSQHGYDMVDPLRISAALGGEAGFRKMAAALKAEGIGLVLDIVPNHMAADPANPYWTDILEFGADSAFGYLYDIDFSRRIALPWLGGPDDEAIQGLAYDEAGRRIVARVASQPVPLRPSSVAMLLDRIGALEAAELWRMLEGGPQRRQAIDAARTALATAVADAPQAFARALETADRAGIHAQQHWEAVPWRETERLNYRRFFEVSHLLGVRIEDDAAFEIVHRLPLALLREGLVEGLRVDHIDGLADPAAYAERLRAEAGEDALILIEKILGAEEALRPWPVDGTTGYERLNLINRAFIAPEGRAAFETQLKASGLVDGTPAERLFAAKRLVLERSFAPEVLRLAQAAKPLAGPVTDTALRTALVALLAAFPVYRSYIAALPPAEADRSLWTEAARRVAIAEPDSAALAERLVGAALDASGAEADRFRLLFQQLSGPAMAKGFEDTELYRSVALTALNEVGADLGTPLPDRDALHAAFAGFSPGGLIPLATHDTKRGADTRARLALLSHQPEAWLARVARWQDRHAAWCSATAPDSVDLWFIYQTLYAAWPLHFDRARTYFEKAIREAKRHGSWNDPDSDYEEGLFAFLQVLLEDDQGAEFRSEMDALVAEMARDAGLFSLAQTVLQLTLPGIPDIYRGTELADLSLVDPDNRRPVDWDRRIALGVAPPRHVALDDPDGVAKFAAIRALLDLRAATPAPFGAPYEPVGIREAGWFAFQRSRDDAALLVAVPLTPEAGRQETITFPDGSADGLWQSALDPEQGTVVVAEGRLIVDPAMPVVVLFRTETAPVTGR